MRIHSTVRSTLLLTLALATAPQIALPVVAEAQPALKPDSGSLGPIVTIVSPEYSDVIKGETQIAIAIQPRRYPAQSVELLVDGRSVSGVLAVQTKFTWKTNLFIDGPHSLMVRVTDTQGFISQAETTIYINNDARVDDASPILRWLGVQQGQKLSGVAKIRLEAADNFGVKYVFLNLNTAIAPDVKPVVASWFTNRPPYEFSIDTTKYEDGLYVLDAYAWDAMENERNAPRLTVSFSNKPAQPSTPVTPPQETAPSTASADPGTNNHSTEVPEPTVNITNLIPPRAPLTPPTPTMFSAPRDSAISSRPIISIEKIVESVHQPTYVATAKLSHPPAQPRPVEVVSPAPAKAPDAAPLKPEVVVAPPPQILAEAPQARALPAEPLPPQIMMGGGVAPVISAPQGAQLFTAPRATAPLVSSPQFLARAEIAVRPDTASAPQSAPHSTTIEQLLNSSVSEQPSSTLASLLRQEPSRLALTSASAARQRSLPASTVREQTTGATDPQPFATTAVSITPEVTVAGRREVFPGSAIVTAKPELPRVASAPDALPTSPVLSARILPGIVSRPLQTSGSAAVTIAPTSAPASATTVRGSAVAVPEQRAALRTGFQATTPSAAPRVATPTSTPRLAAPPASMVFAPRVSSGRPTKVNEIAPEPIAVRPVAPQELAALLPAPVRETPRTLTGARLSVTRTGGHQTRITGAVFQSPLRTTSTSVLPTLPRVAFSPTVRSTPRALEGAAIVVAPSSGVQPHHIAMHDETLAAIAARHKMPLSAIAAANNMPENARVLKGARVLLPQALLVSYKGQAVTGDVAPLLIGTTSVAPFRFLFEKQGGTMSYDAASQCVTARNDKYEVTLEIGSDKAVVNEEEVLMDMAAFLLSGRTMVPVRFFEKALKAKVEWEPSTGRIFVAMTQ